MMRAQQGKYTLFYFYFANPMPLEKRNRTGDEIRMVLDLITEHN